MVEGKNQWTGRTNSTRTALFLSPAECDENLITESLGRKSISLANIEAETAKIITKNAKRELGEHKPRCRG